MGTARGKTMTETVQQALAATLRAHWDRGLEAVLAFGTDSVLASLTEEGYLPPRRMNDAAFLIDGPCPKCRSRGTVIGYLFRTEDGAHQHTKYLCTRWNRGAAEPCGWTDWVADPEAPYEGVDEVRED